MSRQQIKVTTYSQQYTGIYRGKVEQVEGYNPTAGEYNLGRCKIRVPAVNDERTPTKYLKWARPISTTPANSRRSSSQVIPEIGDIVWVLYEGGDKRYPVYIGGTYSTKDVPIDTSKVDIYLEDGNCLQYDKVDKSYKINVGDNGIIIREEGITIVGDAKIKGNIYLSGEVSCDSSLVVNGGFADNLSRILDGDTQYHPMEDRDYSQYAGEPIDGWPILSQAQEGVMLGDTGVSCQSAGCLVTSISQCVANLRGLTSEGALAILKDVCADPSNFNPSGSLKTSQVATKLGISISGDLHTNDYPNAFAKIKADTEAGRGTILHIRGTWTGADGTEYHTTTNGHFLVGIGTNELGVVVSDPGKRANNLKTIPYTDFNRVSDFYVRDLSPLQ